MKLCLFSSFDKYLFIFLLLKHITTQCKQLFQIKLTYKALTYVYKDLVLLLHNIYAQKLNI